MTAARIDRYPQELKGFVPAKDQDLLWTTESLIDELENCIVRVKENQQPERKYLNRAVAVITNWTKLEQNCQHHEIIFNLSDIAINDGKLAAELANLGNATLEYVLHEVTKRLFAMVSAAWFYQSAAEEVEVILKP